MVDAAQKMMSKKTMTLRLVEHETWLVVVVAKDKVEEEDYIPQNICEKDTFHNHYL